MSCAAANFRRKTFDPAVRLVRPAGFHPHELRHTAPLARDRIRRRREGPPADARPQDRDADADLYGHLFPDRLDDLADRMDAAVSAPDVNHTEEDDD
jgi:integrase